MLGINGCLSVELYTRILALLEVGLICIKNPLKKGLLNLDYCPGDLME